MDGISVSCQRVDPYRYSGPEMHFYDTDAIHLETNDLTPALIL